MSGQFHEQGDECLRIVGGSPSNMNYVLMVNSSGLTNSHLLYGALRQVGSQLVVDLAPQIGPGSYVQIRQKTDENDIVAVEVIVSDGSKNKHIKSPEWHYQPINKVQIYDTSFSIGSIPMYLAIGSGISNQELIQFVEKKILI